MATRNLALYAVQPQRVDSPEGDFLARDLRRISEGLDSLSAMLRKIGDKVEHESDVSDEIIGAGYLVGYYATDLQKLVDTLKKALEVSAK